MLVLRFFFLLAGVFPVWAGAQVTDPTFLPLSGELPSPSETRLGSGAPGPAYWQQKADYDIQVTLDEGKRTLSGRETITYHNFSPHTLSYIWVQLDQNQKDAGAAGKHILPAIDFGNAYNAKLFWKNHTPFDGGMTLGAVRTPSGTALSYQLSGTNMRVSLPKPLLPGKTFQLYIEWSYPINDATLEGRCGYEIFPDSNAIFEIAQFYPRVCAYDDINGWQNKSYYGPSEFALEFGDFRVAITVPSDHVVGSTGTLMNADKILTPTQLSRWNELREKNEQVGFIITPEEAKNAQHGHAGTSKTWIFEARNVRDFAFATSRKFVWDVATVTIGGKKIMAQSMYPPDAMPLWDRYATLTIIHTLKVYSAFTGIPYPYPSAMAVHGPVWGMEYPMICFCGGRPNTDGTYSSGIKYATISVIIHEVGHNFFPMIINSDERAWAWQDEGLNSFLQFITEQSFEPNYPSRRGIPETLSDYFRSTARNPIMFTPEGIITNSRTTYEKTAIGLNILRESILGRPLFDSAFKVYCTRWAFRRPLPADFFRSMDDASGQELSWFWREWFFGAEPVDMEISQVTRIVPQEYDPSGAYQLFLNRKQLHAKSRTLLEHRSEKKSYLVDLFPSLKDKYYNPSEDSIINAHQKQVNLYLSTLDTQERNLITGETKVYVIDIHNKGGCIMPITLEVVYSDNSTELVRLPAQIWWKGIETFSYEHLSSKEIREVRLDPFMEYPEADRDNDIFPRPIKQKVVKFY